MKSTPILFSGPMVRAILDGRKTQTRRIIKPQPTGVPELTVATINGCCFAYDEDGSYACPYGQPGDQLWVKETWCAWDTDDDKDWEADEIAGDARSLVERGLTQASITYRADPDRRASRWRPSIFMPRWASRIALEVTAVRVERLQDISEADAIAEGVTIHMDAEITAATVPGIKGPAYLEYFDLWQTINGPGSWAVNPWVWVVEFRKLP